MWKLVDPLCVAMFARLKLKLPQLNSLQTKKGPQMLPLVKQTNVAMKQTVLFKVPKTVTIYWKCTEAPTQLHDMQSMWHTITVQQLHGNNCNETIAMKQLQWNSCNATIEMRQLQCDYCNATIAMKQLHWNAEWCILGIWSKTNAATWSLYRW